jgi:inosose dehydratase
MPSRTTMSTAATVLPGAGLRARLAAGPISWGVCEVPGWGLQLPPERVLAEMHELGISATESGPDGYLGDAGRAGALLAANGLRLVGGFIAVVLHQPAALAATLDKVRRTAAFFAELGGGVICSAAVVDDAWSPPVELTDAQWGHLLDALQLVDAAAAEQGLRHTLHPHWGTLVERAPAVTRVLEGSGVAICLDTGHLALGGADTLAIVSDHADRIGHVHLKDVDEPTAARLRSGELGLVEAVQAGLFRSLGAGDARVEDVVLALERAGYGGWYVLEQDTAITDPGASPADDVRSSVEFLQHVVAKQATEGGQYE